MARCTPLFCILCSLSIKCTALIRPRFHSYLCEYNGIRVAAKTCSSPSSKAQRNFRQELRFYAILSHHSIVKLYGVCLTSTPKFVLLELSDRGTLEHAIARNSSTFALTLDFYVFSVLIEVTSAIAHCHNMPSPVLHRDIKSDNILMREDLSCFVSDFGEAAVLGGDNVEKEKTTTTKKKKKKKKLEPCGTPFYISPENLLSEEVNESSDIFSLGILMLEVSSYYLQRISMTKFFWGKSALNVKPIQAVFSYNSHREKQKICSPRRAMDLIMEGWRPEIPAILRERAPALVMVIEDCWKADHTKRPNAKAVLRGIVHASEQLEGDVQAGNEEVEPSVYENDFFFVVEAQKEHRFIIELLSMRGALPPGWEKHEATSAQISVFSREHNSSHELGEFAFKSSFGKLTPAEVVKEVTLTKLDRVLDPTKSNANAAAFVIGAGVKAHGILQRSPRHVIMLVEIQLPWPLPSVSQASAWSFGHGPDGSYFVVRRSLSSEERVWVAAQTPVPGWGKVRGESIFQDQKVKRSSTHAFPIFLNAFTRKHASWRHPPRESEAVETL